jgi:hypothetical protein
MPACDVNRWVASLQPVCVDPETAERSVIPIDSASLTTAFIHAGIIALAALIHGTIGIGFPMIATPLLALVSDVRSAILLLVLPTVVLNVANILKGGRWSRSIGVYWPLAVYGMIGSLIGTRLLIAVSPEPFRPLLAAMLVLYLNTDRLGVGLSWVHRYPRIAVAVFGLTAGILAGTVNVMLPVLIIFGLEMQMPKNRDDPGFQLLFSLRETDPGGGLCPGRPDDGRCPDGVGPAGRTGTGAHADGHAHPRPDPRRDIPALASAVAGGAGRDADGPVYCKIRGGRDAFPALPRQHR